MLETIRDFFSTVYLEKNHNPAFDTEFITFHGQCLKFESDTNQIKSQKKIRYYQTKQKGIQYYRTWNLKISS